MYQQYKDNSKDGKVLVTGASGFIATRLIQELQKAGYQVRGTVRSLKNKERIQHLYDLCPDAKYPLELVEADLLDGDCWPKVVQGCKYVYHTASPFPASRGPDDEKEIIKPAVDGTLGVLKACEVGGVKRVVLTSSFTAICNFSALPSEKVHTEADFASGNKDSYCHSKYLAEKAAWDFVEGLPGGKKFEFAVVNPSFVFGPAVHATNSTSQGLIKPWMEGTTEEAPMMSFPIVDVRDVVEAHMKAMTLEEANNKRFLLITEVVWGADLCKYLDEEFGKEGYKLPKYDIDLPPAKLILFDNSRMKNMLKITNPIPVKQCIIDMARNMIDFDLIKK